MARLDSLDLGFELWKPHDHPKFQSSRNEEGRAGGLLCLALQDFDPAVPLWILEDQQLGAVVPLLNG